MVQLAAVRRCANPQMVDDTTGKGMGPLSSAGVLEQAFVSKRGRPLKTWAPAACIQDNGVMPKEQVRSRALHYHFFAAHALLLLWRAAENLGLTKCADQLRVALPKTIALLGAHRQRAIRKHSEAPLKVKPCQRHCVILRDQDHFTVADQTARMTLLCQWLSDLGVRDLDHDLDGRNLTKIAESACQDVPLPSLELGLVLHSGMVPYGNLIW